MARVPYLDPTDVPAEYRELMHPKNPHLRTTEAGEEEGWDEFTTPRNTHRALAHNPAILDAYRRFGAAVWQEAGLTPRERELVILTVGRTLDNAYEWHQHARTALTVGVPEDELLAIAEWEPEAFADRDRALIEYTAAFVEGTVDDALHETFLDYRDHATLIGVTQLAGYYLAIDRMGRALDLDFEEPFIGWTLENR